MDEVQLTKGDSLNFIFEIEETKQDLESCFFTCVKNKSDTNYVFIKSLNNGIKKSKNDRKFCNIFSKSSTRRH